MAELANIIGAMGTGDRQAADDLLPLVYAELRRLAAFKMAALKSGDTLQPTALVHEAWIKLTSDESRRFAGRVHFFAAAAEAMRHILIDAARRKQAARHGGGLIRLDIADVEIAGVADSNELLAVHAALDKLAAEQPQAAEVAKLRYFLGLTFEQVAEVRNISVRTAKREWAFARAWLYEEIKGESA